MGGYGPQVIDAVYTLERRRHPDKDGREDPDRSTRRSSPSGQVAVSSFSGYVALDNVEPPGQNGDQQPAVRDEPNRRLAVPLSETSAEFVVVGRTVGNTFLWTAGAAKSSGGWQAHPADPDPRPATAARARSTWALSTVIFGLFLPILLCIGVGFYLYRRKKIENPQAKGYHSTSPGRAPGLQGERREHAVVVEAAAPGGSAEANAGAPAKWYWEESVARLTAHAVVKPPHGCRDDQTRPSSRRRDRFGRRLAGRAPVGRVPRQRPRDEADERPYWFPGRAAVRRLLPNLRRGSEAPAMRRRLPHYPRTSTPTAHPPGLRRGRDLPAKQRDDGWALARSYWPRTARSARTRATAGTPTGAGSRWRRPTCRPPTN